jgi:hypothetical protein
MTEGQKNQAESVPAVSAGQILSESAVHGAATAGHGMARTKT